MPTEVPKKMNKEELQKLVSKALENSKRKVHKLIKHIGLFFRTTLSVFIEMVSSEYNPQGSSNIKKARKFH